MDKSKIEEYIFKLDFLVPKKYRGEVLELKVEDSLTIRLDIPQDAVYLDVNPLEDEEEFLGDQSDSDRQELIYYNNKKQPIKTQGVEYIILTCTLMRSLEDLFEKLY